jgi:putative Mn2+ efflux pump MntP
MPLIGYFLGTQFESYITFIDHWIAFILLTIIGIKMIKESRSCSTDLTPAFTLGNLLILSIATSIDALAVGITFAFLHVNILPAIAIIGITTFILSFIGVRIGNLCGLSFKSKAEMLGGIILIAMGLKILLEHLHIIQF